MKSIIFFDTTKEKILNQIPRSLKIFIEELNLSDNNFLIIMFPEDRKKVVDSGAVKKSFGKIPDTLSEEKYVIGGSFTKEAIELLENRGFIVNGKVLGFWTDENLHNSRQGK